MSSDTTPRVAAVEPETVGRLDEETIASIATETNRGRRWWLWGALAVIVVVGGAIALSLLGDGADSAPAEQAINTSEVVRTDLADADT